MEKQEKEKSMQPITIPKCIGNYGFFLCAKLESEIIKDRRIK